jgi:hypothetical protein
MLEMTSWSARMPKAEVSCLLFIVFYGLPYIGLLDQTEISYISGKTVCWLDYLPSPGLVLAATGTFCAVGMLDGTLNVYSPTGRR